MKVPDEILKNFEAQSDGLVHGECRLTVVVRDGRPRYVIAREQSIHIPETDDGEKAGA